MVVQHFNKIIDGG